MRSRRIVLPRWVRRLDRRAAAWRNRRWAPHPLDHLLRGLSTHANRGVLWIALAGVIALLGGREGRRAAVRGLASLAAASALANLVGKTLFGGDRPLLDEVPFRRRLSRPPTSPSFPSGHAASAAAFVTGVAIESPPAGAALAPVALGVAYSRLHTGSHWLSDVLAGIALGTGVALAGSRILTRHDGPAGPRARVPASADGDGVLLLVNPAAGSGAIRRDPVAAFQAAFPKARVEELTRATTPEDLRKLVRSSGARILGVSGGDGTVGTVSALAVELDLPLVVIPGGTLNHFARTAGVTHVGDTIEALRAGSGVAVDTAVLQLESDEHPVLNTFAVGIYPELVEEREKRERKLGKWPAAVVAGLLIARRAEPVEVLVDGEPRRIWLVFAGVNRYLPRTLLPLRRTGLDDGILDLRLLHATARAPRLCLLLNLALGNQLGDVVTRVPKLHRLLGLEFREQRSVRLRTGAEPIAWDGEARADPGEVELRMRPERLRVYAPERHRRRTR